jgi:uncharacterized protein
MSDLDLTTDRTDIQNGIGRHPTRSDCSVPPAADLDEVLLRLRGAELAIRAHAVTGLYVFGSAARNDLRPGSDVDVFVDYQRGSAVRSFSLIDLVGLREELPLILGRPVDVFTRRGLHRLLAADIQASAIKVF